MGSNWQLQIVLLFGLFQGLLQIPPLHQEISITCSISRKNMEKGSFKTIKMMGKSKVS